jgi:cytochrome P450
VRRCLGASFAQLEMSVVISTILQSVSLRAVDPADEEVARRRFTFAPGAGAKVEIGPLGAFCKPSPRQGARFNVPNIR